MILKIGRLEVEMNGTPCHSVEMMIIKGKTGYIISESDCCHRVYSLSEFESKITLVVSSLDSGSNRSDQFYLNMKGRDVVPELKPGKSKSLDLKKFIHYFGIKPRVRRNYEILQESCKLIGAEVDFPEWERGK